MLNKLKPEQRVGIVAGIDPDPFDPDFVQVKVYKYTPPGTSKAAEDSVKTVLITARNAQVQRLTQGDVVVVGLLGNVHSASKDELKHFQVDTNRLHNHYRAWRTEARRRASVTSHRIKMASPNKRKTILR